MIPMQTLKKSALTAMLAAFAAVPLTVNASDDTSTDAVQPAQPMAPAVQVSAVSAPALQVYRMVDPVAAAETYAPATVEDWKATLDRYDALRPKMKVILTKPSDDENTVPRPDKVAITITAAAPGAEGPGPVRIFYSAAVAADTGSPDQPAAVAGPDGNVVIGAAHLPEGEPDAVPAVPAWIPGATPDLIPDGAPDMIRAVSAVTLDGAPDAVRAIPAWMPDASLMEAEIALSQAVEAKEAEAIKQALTKLLEKYKEKIAEWEAASTADTGSNG
ncbi:hypothetical protein [Gorillibacterium sp. sgz5001074]|uniref:hypothetical protein n=1 Tax=Gorillibacterium sp. sgz5001074 TaxID=3446695 RepID=UPI003F66D636